MMGKEDGEAKWCRERKVKEGGKLQRNIEIEDGKTEEKKELKNKKWLIKSKVMIWKGDKRGKRD